METCRQIDKIQWQQDNVYFKFTNQISQNRKQVAVWSVTDFLLSIRETVFSVFESSNLSLLPIFSAFVKKRFWLCFTDGSIWPSKISNGLPKNLKGAKHGPQNFWPGDNTVLCMVNIAITCRAALPALTISNKDPVPSSSSTGAALALLPRPPRTRFGA